MKRRDVLKAGVGCGLGLLAAPLARAGAEARVLCRKQLGPTATTIAFAQHELGLGESFKLKPSGNALWINSLRWLDANATWHHIMIKRNVAPEKDFPLHLGPRIRQLELSVTTLPFKNSSTEVTLSG
jgi:hypothetical protein